MDKLLKLDDNKLLDVVKNYRKYNYDKHIQIAAIEELTKRGVHLDFLKKQETAGNKTYENIQLLYIKFCRNSKLSLLFYFTYILLIVATSFSLINTSPVSAIISIAALYLNFTLYIIFITITIIAHKNFYKKIGQPKTESDILIWVVIGIPLYILAYFYYRAKMKEDYLHSSQ